MTQNANNWLLRGYEARLECIWQLVSLGADRDMIRAGLDREGGYDVEKAASVKDAMLKDRHRNVGQLLELYGGEMHKVPWPLALHWHSSGQIMTAQHYPDGRIEYRA